jgi:hypothetical protein
MALIFALERLTNRPLKKNHSGCTVFPGIAIPISPSSQAHPSFNGCVRTSYKSPTEKKLFRLYRFPRYCHTDFPPPRKPIPHLTARSPIFRRTVFWRGAYGRFWRVAFASLTHNRLSAVARLPDHSNSLLRVLLLESNSFKRATLSPQLHLDCAVFNSPKRHAVVSRFGSGRTNQNKQFGQAESPIKNPANNFCYGDLNGVCVFVYKSSHSGKWLVGPSSTSNRATSFFISLGDTGRCYGVSLRRADASDQRRARCLLPFFGVTGLNATCHRTEHVGALLALKLSRCM